MKNLTVEINNSVEALLTLEDGISKKRNLFSKDKNVCLKISLFRIPKMRGFRKKYLNLCHSRFGDDPEICLFVPNRKSNVEYKISTDDCIDMTVEYYQNFLGKHKVNGIKTIMPVKQLQSEYAPYELRRKLVNRFDLFLCKTSLLYNPRFMTSLGKFFIKQNKEPMGITFPAWDAPFDENFQKNIERAILSTSFKIKPTADNYAIPVGMLSQTKQHICDNLKVVIDQLINDDVIPGGFANVRGLYLGTSDVRSVPLYIAEDLPDNLKTPKVKSRRGRIKAVEGEITTLPGKKVVVMPSGKVRVMPIATYEENKTEDSDELDEIDDDSDEEDTEEAHPGFNGGYLDSDGEDDVAFAKNEKSQQKKNKSKLEDEDEDEDDEDDDEIEEREKRLLRKCNLFKDEYEEINEESESDEAEQEKKEPPRKKMKKVDTLKKTKTKKNDKLKKINKKLKKGEMKV